MSTKHRTKVVAIPTKIITIPLLECDEEIIVKLHRHNPSTRRNHYSETQYWIVYKSDEYNCYFPFSVPLSELHKKNRKRVINTLLDKMVPLLPQTARGPLGSRNTACYWLSIA